MALNLGSPAVLAELDTALTASPYVSGFQPSADDLTVFVALTDTPCFETVW
jgi:hypothetical protein